MKSSERMGLKLLALGVMAAGALVCLGLGGLRGAEELKTQASVVPRRTVLLASPGLRTKGLRGRGLKVRENLARTTQLKGMSGLAGAGLFWGDALKPDDENENDRMKDWSDDEDQGLQAEADNALVLCDDVLSDPRSSGRWNTVTGSGAAGAPSRCVHRVISRKDSRYTNTIAGRNNWNQDHMAITLGKIIDQFKPHTKGIMKDGKIVHVPHYDRSSFRGYGAGHQLASDIESPADMDMYSEKGLDVPEDTPDGPGGREEGLAQLSRAMLRRKRLGARGREVQLRRARLQALQAYMPTMEIGSSAIMENAVVTPELAEPQGVAPGAYQPVKGQPLTPYIQSSTAGPCTNNEQLSNTAGCNQEFYYQPWYDKYPQQIVSSVANIPPPVTIQPATVTRADAPLSEAVVTPVTVVDQPWASYAGLPSEQTIVTGCKDGYSKDCKQPPQDGSETYNVKIEAEPKGCGTPGRKTVWDGDLDVKPINCAPEVDGDSVEVW